MSDAKVDVEVLDTTLRDGAQTSGISFSLQDKLSITQKLDELGISYIEGGWPGSNPKDIEYFKAVKSLSLENAEVVAFGSTKRKGLSSDEDPNLRSLLEADVNTVVIFGKSWTLHAKDVLKIALQDNLELVYDTISYLKAHGIKVIFDAEHFFDGYKEDRDYALKVVKTAEEAGANVIVLADTNGGSLTHEIEKIVKDIRKDFEIPLGIHAHNDSGLAVANTLMAVINGCGHVQGTINGLGERCGNADLIQVIPALELKLGLKALKGHKDKLVMLTSVSRYIYELLNLSSNPYQPYVGSKAFAHKGGVHVDAVLKTPKAYEHIDPSLVGNKRELLVSELAGRAAVINEALKLGLRLEKQSEAVTKTLEEIKRLEAQGYLLENADASRHLILFRNLGVKTNYFDIIYWMAMARKDEEEIEAEGQVIVRTEGEISYAKAVGVGPVHALDKALKKAILKRFPTLKKVELLNYKVTVVDSGRGTASYVRVFIEFGDGKSRWATTSTSDNILEASAMALQDGYNYRLLLDDMKDGKVF